MALGAGAVHATEVNDPVKIRLVGPPRSAEAGSHFSGELEVTASRPARVEGLESIGEGWAHGRLMTGPAVALESDRPARIAFQVPVADPSRPLVLRAAIDGRFIERSFDLSPAAVARMLRPRRAVALPGSAPELAAPRGADGHRAAPPAVEDPSEFRPEPEDDPAIDAGPQETVAARDIRVRGRFVYLRPDGVTLGADNITVHVRDSDPGPDDELASAQTDAYGYFDIGFTWDQCCEGDPDLYVEFEAKNGEVEVEDATWEINYRWATQTYSGYGGSSLDLGTMYPAEESDHPAVHLLTSVTRAWRWYVTTEGLDSDALDVQWPDADASDSGAYYDSFWEEIHISGDGGSQHSDWDAAHEYGHHFMKHHCVSPSPDYCNGVCDEGGCSLFDSGGHCLWCAEKGNISWTEGFSDWLATVQCEAYQADYGIPAAPAQREDLEQLNVCSETGGFQDPWQTEGVFAAFLRDVWDATDDYDANALGGAKDVLALGSHPIMLVATQDGVSSPGEFGLALRNRHPGYRQAIWETARHDRYEFDISAPGAVAMLGSTSHTVGTSSADATIDLWWQEPADDWSGAGGYSVLVAAAPMLPDAVAEMGAGYTFKTAPLAPGAWYVSVRALDRAGHWSATYASTGPYTIVTPTGANLAWVNHAGWYAPVVPSPASNNTLSSCPKPTSLGTRTYLNFHGKNNGDAMAGSPFPYRVDVLLDGKTRIDQRFRNTDPGASVYAVNQGPTSVAAGRHTLSGHLDQLESEAETNEADNVYGRQYSWSASSPAPTTPLATVAPIAQGGWEDVTTGSTFPNCLGVYLDESGAWDAVVAKPGDAVSNHDVDLFFHSTSVDTGFAVPRATSGRPAGCIDAVLVNRRMLAGASWDAGVRLVEGLQDVTVEYVPSKPLTLGDSVKVGLGPGHMMELIEVSLPLGLLGPEAVLARVVSGHGPLQLAWFDRNFTRGGLADCAASARIEDGVATLLRVTAPGTGYYLVALFRDPRDGGEDSVTVALQVRTDPPDYRPYARAGWYAPMVPRPAPDGTWGSCPAPDTLLGDALESTYLNYGIYSDCARIAPAMNGDKLLDGLSVGTFSTGAFSAYEARAVNDGIPVTVRGGRHTLGMACDPLAAVAESNEDNNRWAEQWVWGPRPLAFDTPQVRAFPPAPMGGWPDLPTGDRWYNCDGVRTPLLGMTGGQEGRFGAVAAMPGASSDVDLRLHVAADGVKSGFQSGLAFSDHGPGQSEYVLVNTSRTSLSSFDVGALDGGGTPQAYSIEAARSSYEGANPNGAFGPFTLGAGRILRLHDFDLAAGRHVFRLDELAGGVDWGFTLHPADSAYLSKNARIEPVAEWPGGAGQGEQMEFDVPTAGHYCLAVWKSGTADLPKPGSYRLDVRRLSVTAERESPTRTALAAIGPNPFATRVAVDFDLAQEAGVRLEVYDVRGGRLRTLADGRWPAGRHRVEWDGTEASGRRAPPGVYVVRFAAGGASGTRKLVRLE